jgi:hypothetical protein
MTGDAGWIKAATVRGIGCPECSAEAGAECAGMVPLEPARPAYRFHTASEPKAGHHPGRVQLAARLIRARCVELAVERGDR